MTKVPELVQDTLTGSKKHLCVFENLALLQLRRAWP
jgi:ABC-type uncharacterized transport system ATPase component